MTGFLQFNSAMEYVAQEEVQNTTQLSGTHAHAAVSGAVVLTILFSLFVAIPLSFWLVRRYRRAVIKGMGYEARSFKAPPENPEHITQQRTATIVVKKAGSLPKHSSHTFYRVSETLGWHWFCYIGICLVFAVYTSIINLYHESGISFLGYSLQILAFSIPFVPISFLLLANGRKQKLILTGFMLMVYFLLAVIVWGKNSNKEVGFLSILTPLFLYNILPLMIYFLLRLKSIRNIGLTVMGYTTLTIGAPVLLYDYLSSDMNLTKQMFESWFDTATAFILFFTLLPLALGGIIAWQLLRSLKRWYARKVINDLQLQADAVLIIFALCYSIFMFDRYPGTGLMMLLAYPVARFSGLRLYALLRKRGRPGKAPRLLLLRVFALGEEVEGLFERIQKHWRYIGSTQMISGPDLALSTLDLHEMLDFVTGNLKHAFCEDEASIERNISQADHLPDLDSTYRVNEFFCRDNNWKTVLQKLLTQSDVVLMDLRRFTESNKGSRHEIDALVAHFPLRKTIFLTNDHTDMAYTRKVMDEAFSKATAQSVNMLTNDPVTLLHCETGNDDEVYRIANHLCTLVDSEEA